ncbi:putative ATP-dependent DNA helicase YjcD [Crateriforma conspicua]|uniref:DNA 3'-5' helicase n=1 Tax=Crateriforma conspicua TaxID=2527996 RepID=A0A5C6FVK9_9PLAN|nr:3'-5' exonuclease [Crateriforma conspicua]TWU65500.1 putative ATP-dependent DNA helicase YjcD [Crateriforma conspicua]
MHFRISDTFTDSLTRLTADEQKAVKTTAFDLQVNPANPGLQFHRIDRCKDKNFWSIRAGRDIRVIVHKTDASLLLCYVDHHDKAYQWAEKRKLERHPKTGAAQLVEIRETVREIEVPTYVEAAPQPTPPCLSGVVREDLLTYGVPDQWVDDCLAADEDHLLTIADRLPGEAAEALLVLATGGRPEPRSVAAEDDDPFSHPDAQRRFRVLDNADELAAALDAPWEKWIVFLHPSQRGFVDRRFSGPARVSGSAGTGKTIVAIHRAAAALKQGKGHVLLTTISDDLAKALYRKTQMLVPNDRLARTLPPPTAEPTLVVASLNDIACQMAAKGGAAVAPVDDEYTLEQITAIVEQQGDLSLSPQFLRDEWNDVVDGWCLHSWDEYRDFKRLGRKTRLSESGREQAWTVFVRLRSRLSTQKQTTWPMLLSHLSETATSPFISVVVDECQDVSPTQLRLLARMTSSHPGELFFAGDLGQRIFQTPFSWSALGVNIRGRSRTLKINYRTSHQIRQHADRLLDGTISDVDGNEEHRDGTISVFNGPPPEIYIADNEDLESDRVADWLNSLVDDGVAANEIAIFTRSPDQLARAREAVKKASDLSGRGLGTIQLASMHDAKGLEFRCVSVMACDDDILPLDERIRTLGDNADLEDIYNTERYLLYVACTRARDRLLITGVDPASEFLDDLRLEME